MYQNISDTNADKVFNRDNGSQHQKQTEDEQV